jgi:hypothetical protein
MNCKKAALIIMIFMIATVTASCKRDGENSQEPSSAPTSCPKDTFFLFQIIEAGETNKNGYPVTLLILNQSNYSAVFPADYGLELFVEEGDDWRELKYEFSFAEGQHVLKTRDINPSGLHLPIFPFVPELKESVRVRIQVTGYIEGQEDCVASASIDIDLEPSDKN